MRYLIAILLLLVISSTNAARCKRKGGSCKSSASKCTDGTVRTDLKCSSSRVCCMPGEGSTTVRPTPSPGSCGQSRGTWIVGGQEAEPHNWPWQLSLQMKYSGSWHHICGATLISPNVAVTAAHCVEDGSEGDFKVIAGLHHQNDQDDATHSRITRIIMHENYDGANAPWPHDIALLFLAETIDESHKIGFACLPHETQDFSPSDQCFITGWGDTAGTGDSKRLNELDIDVVPNSECKNLWGSKYILAGHVCVGMGNTGSCNGDSGGPLVCRHEGRWVLAGATSWGHVGCKEYGYPSVYTRVSKYVDWIENKRSLMNRIGLK